ncbi:hypothetical protein GWK47_027102 [Chionoecetes opilio]|uniref:Uncharacterized protein n=1 Tax=Chionoecetes opilio TaxID=41210 RepID=A0A8J8WMQ9_CHIOP|nr:hypothetical protein GWK47_027102 [Chionoecetes opilio]
MAHRKWQKCYRLSIRECLVNLILRKRVTDPCTFFSERKCADILLTTFMITREDIIQAISNIDPQAAAGPRWLPYCVSEKIVGNNWPHPEDTGTTSLLTGSVPHELNVGTITPIHKGEKLKDRQADTDQCPHITRHQRSLKGY